MPVGSEASPADASVLLVLSWRVGIEDRGSTGPRDSLLGRQSRPLGSMEKVLAIGLPAEFQANQRLTTRMMVQLLSVTKMTLWRWVKAGRMPAPNYFNGRNYWRRGDVETWLARQKTRAEQTQGAAECVMPQDQPTQ